MDFGDTIDGSHSYGTACVQHQSFLVSVSANLWVTLMSCAETTTRICKDRNTTFDPEQKKKHSIHIDNEAVKTNIHLKLGTHKVLHMLSCNKNLCAALADGPREIDEPPSSAN